MSLIARLVVIFFAFLIASFFGGLVVAVAVMMREWTNLTLGPVDHGLFAVFAAFGFVFVSGFAFLPGIVAIVIAEAVPLRSVVFYAAAGAAIGVIVYASLGGFDIATLRYDSFERRETEIMAAAGIVAGLVYWLVAGRNAGRWREVPPASLDRR